MIVPLAQDVVVGFCRGYVPRFTAASLISKRWWGSRTSAAIEWWGGGYFSHVTTLLPNRREVIDSRSDHVCGVPPGVEVRPLESLNGSDVVWRTLRASRVQACACYEMLFSQLHKPYDFAGIFGFASDSLIDRNWRDERAWFCDELAVWSWEKVGIIPILTLPAYRITPGGASIAADSAQAMPFKFAA
jgi:hypothetical protein